MLWGEILQLKREEVTGSGRKCILLLLLLDNKIKEQGMGGTCTMYEETEKCIQNMVKKI